MELPKWIKKPFFLKGRLHLPVPTAVVGELVLNPKPPNPEKLKTSYVIAECLETRSIREIPGSQKQLVKSPITTIIKNGKKLMPRFMERSIDLIGDIETLIKN